MEKSYTGRIVCTINRQYIFIADICVIVDVSLKRQHKGSSVPSLRSQFVDKDYRVIFLFGIRKGM